MSILDKVVAAVTPEPSDERKMEVRAGARALARDSGWLASILDHHEEIEALFVEVRGATTAVVQRESQKKLAMWLTGHSLAEEAVIYPAMALTDQKGRATEAFAEQSAAKVQIAALDELEPLTQDYLDKLEHLRAAVAHHVFEEESEWFPKLRQIADTAKQATLSRRYREEFERYMGS